VQAIPSLATDAAETAREHPYNEHRELDPECDFGPPGRGTAGDLTAEEECKDDRGVAKDQPRAHAARFGDPPVVAPGENGLLIGSEDDAAEAWCVQKSNFASRRGRLTRADRIANELLDVVELHDPPFEDEETGVCIRRARPDESRLLTRLERAASERALAHVFPPEQHPYPVTAVAKRWRHLLGNRLMHAYLLEVHHNAAGYVAFDADTVHHLGVVPDHTRRGYGSALLEFACLEIYAGGAREAFCWVLVDNHVARAFYRTLGWIETGERRKSEFPPHPLALQMMQKNPHAPRRSL